MPESPYLTLIEVEGLLPGASNATLLARDEDGDPWVYKPDEGERPLWDFPYGTLGKREVACYRVSRALGLDVVPETLLAEGPYGTGSAQRFLYEDRTWDPRPLIVESDPILWPIALLDLIINNADRKIGHLLREPGGRHVWAIDNGLSFHPEPKLRTVLWSFAGQEIPADLLARCDPAPVEDALTDLLHPVEVKVTTDRLRHVLAEPVHPDPPVDRPPMPWPLW